MTTRNERTAPTYAEIMTKAAKYSSGLSLQEAHDRAAADLGAQRQHWILSPDEPDDDGGAVVIAFGAIGIVAMVVGCLLTLAAQAIW